MNTPHNTRILHITSFFYPHVGGSQRYMEELFAHLVQRHSDVQVDVLCYNTDNAPEKEVYKGLTVYRIPCWQIIRGRFNLPNPFSLIRMLHSLKKNNYTHVQTHLRFFDTTWWAWMYARSIGATAMFTEHVATHPVYQIKPVEWIALLVDKTIGRWSISRYNVIMTTNAKARQFLMKTLKVKKPVHIVFGGVDTEWFSQKIEQEKRIFPHVEKEFKSSDIIISFAARFIWTKGVTILYEAIKKIAATLPENVYFILAGDGELSQSLKQQIANNGLSEKVFLTGSLTPEEIRSLLQNTDIFAHPSHHNEGFPNSILEAGAAGCYVIASDIGGTDEIIYDSTVGALIPPKNVQALTDSLMWALKHPEECKEKARQLNLFIREKLDWNHIQDVYYKLL